MAAHFEPVISDWYPHIFGVGAKTPKKIDIFILQLQNC